jgi:glycosyltransferase involved in cell wall biosynthesis
VFCPSAYLRDVAVGWGLDPGRSSVLPNPVPDPPSLPDRAGLREELGLEGKVLVFAGRLGPQKDVDTLLEALVRVPEVTLAIAGDGPERRVLERRAGELGLDGRVCFLGSVPRDTVLRLFGAADACVLPSAWENFPHTVVEALAVGCPVIATAVGGVPEVVVDGENGLLVPARDAQALAAAIARFFSDDGLRRDLAAAAARSVASCSEEAVFATIEGELEKAVSG